MPSTRQLLAAPVLLLAVLAGGACGGPAGAPETPPSSGSATSPSTAGSASSPAPSASDPAAPFCAGLKANGATGASFGPVQLQLRKEAFLADVQDKLDAMGDATPPSEVGKAWTVQKEMLQKARATAEKLSADESLGTATPPVDLSEFHGDEIDEAQDTLTDYWFDRCG